MGVKVKDNKQAYEKFKKQMNRMSKKPHVAIGILG